MTAMRKEKPGERTSTGHHGGHSIIETGMTQWARGPPIVA